MARPRTEITEVEFGRLCGIFSTLEDIAAYFHCSEDTIQRWCKRELKCSFAEAFKKYSANGRNSLRAMLYNHAKKNVAACIFLCKNYLGMKDNPRELTIKTQNGRVEELLKAVMEEPVMPQEEFDKFITASPQDAIQEDRL